jgi:YVTN family beta-propeller protein
VVANKGENTVSLIDAEDLTLADSISLNHSPIAIAIAPDGLKAYVASNDSNSVSVIDLVKRRVAREIDVGAPQEAIALTPQGDRIYVITTRDKNNPLKSIQIGMRLPAEWNLTAGWVTPFCLPDPFHLIAVLGIPSQTPLETAGNRVTPMPSALSQTVPVAQACPYEFSFWGIATASDAVAEVIWIGKDCGLLRTDQVPIQAFKPGAVGVEPNALTRAASVAASRPQLVLHRVRLMAPVGTEQAEVRFHVPEGVAAAIDRVSLIATTEAVANADLSLRQRGRVAGWDWLAGTVSSVTTVTVKDGVQLRNASAETAELVQAIPVEGDRPFDLEFRGRTITSPSAKDKPRLELRWFKSDHLPAGAPLILEILPAGFDLALARGVSPSGASDAELCLVVPPGTTLETKRVSLKFSTTTPVPVTFIAQAPGELTVSNWRVAFEQAEVSAPLIPDTGVCTPTPPGRQPGETPDDCCFCPCCQAERTLTEVTPVETRAGRPARVGRCAACGTELVLFGGARKASVQPLSLYRRPDRGMD